MENNVEEFFSIHCHLLFPFLQKKVDLFVVFEWCVVASAAAVCIRVDRWAWLHVRQKGRPLRLAALQVPEDGFEQRVTPRGENYFRPSEAPASARRKQGSLRRSLLDDLTDDVRN